MKVKKGYTRFELVTNEKLIQKIRVWCVRNSKTHGEWAEIAHKALTA